MSCRGLPFFIVSPFFPGCWTTAYDPYTLLPLRIAHNE
jgi:hypothetical protein